ncbi:MAG: DnaJ domain-containing protein [Myxococcota bacterium]
MADDYYGVLGVSREASSQEIKRAFREIARQCHPDVVGSDATAEERFKNARKAYETLMDPVARARYDRRGQRVGSAGSFFDAFYRATARNQRPAAGGRMRTGQPPNAEGAAASTPRGGDARPHPGNAVGLDDLLNDFGFGGARVNARAGSDRPPTGGGFQEARVKVGAARTRSAEPAQERARAPSPERGEDVHVDLEVPGDLAVSGGSLTAVYNRMQRSDSWRPGGSDPGLVRVQDIADVRILPGTADGEVLRERGLGSAGSHGGPYGDLVVSVRVIRITATPSGAVGDEAEPSGPTVDLSIVEALLGGRVSLDTPQGKVRLTIPPGTSSGVRLRLKGRGPVGADGAPSDWYVVTRIVVPKALDAESRRLIEAFAQLNPSPHD